MRRWLQLPDLQPEPASVGPWDRAGCLVLGPDRALSSAASDLPRGHGVGGDQSDPRALCISDQGSVPLQKT